MPRRFEYIGGRSRKFWEIDLSQCTVLLRWGRLGTQGQTKVVVFTNSYSAERYVEDRVDEKRAKGYMETATPAVKDYTKGFSGVKYGGKPLESGKYQVEQPKPKAEKCRHETVRLTGPNTWRCQCGHEVEMDRGVKGAAGGEVMALDVRRYMEAMD